MVLVVVLVLYIICPADLKALWVICTVYINTGTVLTTSSLVIAVCIAGHVNSIQPSHCHRSPLSLYMCYILYFSFHSQMLLTKVPGGPQIYIHIYVMYFLGIYQVLTTYSALCFNNDTFWYDRDHIKQDAYALFLVTIPSYDNDLRFFYLQKKDQNVDREFLDSIAKFICSFCVSSWTYKGAGMTHTTFTSFVWRHYSWV